MKAVPLAFRGVLIGLLTSSLHAQGPILTTPGTATWLTETTDTGTRTIFTITGNTVLDWNRMNLESGSELVFDFVGGNSVVNNLTGTKQNVINGSVSSNGFVGFFSPNAILTVNGNITAKGVTLATLDVNPIDFAAGDYVLSGGTGKMLTVVGQVTATQGDVVLASKRLSIFSSAAVDASGSALYSGGESASVSSSGIRRINVVGSIGAVSHQGTTTAGRAEIEAKSSIVNNGRIDVGTSKIFLEVGQGGNISNEAAGIIVGSIAFEGSLINKGVLIEPYDGDVLPSINESRLKVPALRKPDGSNVNSSKTISYSAPMSASSDAGRVAEQKDRQVSKVDSSKSLLKRSSFFGMRGGKTIASR